MIASQSGIRMYSDTVHLQRSDADFKAGVCFCTFPGPSSRADMVNALHPQEADYYHSLAFEKRKNSYLIGRYAAKHAICAFTGEKDGLQGILIQPGIFNHPITTCERAHNVQVSISHDDQMGSALAFSEAHPMGIDIERIHFRRQSVLESQMTNAELQMIRSLRSAYGKLLTVLWTVKEALSKVLKTGLITPFPVFEIKDIELHPGGQSVCTFKNFGQYKAISFEVGPSVCSIVCPEKTDMKINIPQIAQVFGLDEV